MARLLTAEQKARRDERNRAWVRANPERVKAAGKKWRDANKEHNRKRKAVWCAANKHRRRGYVLRGTYRLSVAEYDALLAAQNGGCAICGEAETGARSSKLHIDHDHATGKVRALLCNHCNRGLGGFRDDPDRLRRAILYLVKHSKASP